MDMMYVQNVFRGAYNCLCEVTLQALARADSVYPWRTGLCERASGDIIFTRQNATYDRLELSYLVVYGWGLRFWVWLRFGLGLGSV